MADMFDYLFWRGDLGFDDVPLNDADALILCQLAYIDYSDVVPGAFLKKGMTLADAAEKLAAPEWESCDFSRRFFTEETKRLLMAAGKTRRFGQLGVTGCRHIIDMEKEEQFSALTFVLGDGSLFTAYSGTDAMIVGWQEDFNLGWKDVVPAQADALSYLTEAAAALHGAIRIGGHSKGGNLALYAASHAPSKVQKRVTGVWNFDGPGFKPEFFQSAGYRAVEPVIRNFKPALSVVGMLFTNSDRYTVVKSSEKGVMQHYAPSWQMQPGGFDTLPELDERSMRIERAINGWFDDLEQEQKRVFVETVFGILKKSTAETSSELAENWTVTLPNILKAMTHLDAKTRNAVRQTLEVLAKNAFEAARE